MIDQLNNINATNQFEINNRIKNDNYCKLFKQALSAAIYSSKTKPAHGHFYYFV